MKLSFTLITATAGFAAAQPHHHRHRHLERRAPAADGVTVIVYELRGKPIPYSQVQEGIKNGSLVWADNGGLSSAASSAYPTSTLVSVSSTLVAPTMSPTPTPTPTIASTSSKLTPIPVSSISPSVQDKKVKPPPAAPRPTPSVSSSDSTSGVDAPFPDGQIDCSTFPSQYGAMAVDWLKLGGWTGIQTPGTTEAAGYNDIHTATSGACTEGSFCSYACPAGYQKSQWPSLQGATGQSIGGVLCRDGKLHLTNPGLSKTLCMRGTDKIIVQIQNKLGQNAAVCRTDYPGTESETIPLDTQPGMTHNLTCPDAAKYYKWLGGSTSAQYYVNPAGVSAENACQWGTSGKPWGNWAPLNLGVGYSGGSAWLSIFQNAPTTKAKLDFSVEIVGDDGGYDNLGGRCKYQDGKYCSGANYESCNNNGNGCTVAVSSGSATFIFS